MPVAKLLREQTIGETRWAALDARGEPVALYLERASDQTRAVIGKRLEAKVRKVDPVTAGAFVDLGARGEGFLRLKPAEKHDEGTTVVVEIAAEARRGKLARVRIADPGKLEAHGAARWRASLTGGVAAAIEDVPAGHSGIQSAFDDALSATITLPGGGRLQAERTEALIAADIDTAGRVSRGSRADAALAINLEAAASLARQLLLRGWGGLCVLDCIAPINKDAGAKIQAGFLTAFRTLSNRQVKALAPSEFGLMEISADWQVTPLAERMLEPDGRPSGETLALGGLRLLEMSARANRMSRLSLELPATAIAWLSASGLGAEDRLAQTYGARLTIRPSEALVPQVTAT